MHHPLQLVAFLRGRKIHITVPSAGKLTLGRAQVSDIRLNHPSVSRTHLILHAQENVLEVEDMGSSYGTRIVSAGRALSNDILGEETHNTADEWRLPSGERRKIGEGDMIRVGNVLLRVEAAAPSTHFKPEGSEVIECDPATVRVNALARKVAEGNISVLLLGETGVGKDVLAQLIHRSSSREKGPFVRIHCAALSENLLESELFGHVRGAFTGASNAKAGLIESAHGGTVFLDEIGEMPLQTQVKLLNVLETGEVQRIGSTKPQKVDVRYVAATNRDLPDWVEKGNFRRDLYFRINGITLSVPPLRERKGDIEPLARRFFEQARERNRQPWIPIEESCVEFLRAWHWPGNLRELKNVMERSALLCGDAELTVQDIRLDQRPPTLSEDDFDDLTQANQIGALAEIAQLSDLGVSQTKNRERVVAALEACSGNQTRAASSLGVSRRTLINWLDEFGLPRPRKSS